MRRREFRPWAVSDGSLRLRGAGRPAVRSRAAGGGRKPRSRLLIAGAVTLVAAVAWVGVQLLRPVPSMTLTASVTTMRALPEVAPRPDWPGRAEAAIGLPVTGLLGAHGGSRPVPIASLAKIMTGYAVLRDRPLPTAGPGPVIAVAAADAAAYARDQRQEQSVVRVAAWEKLTERQALEAMLIPSGNNVASLLARWDAGSEAAFAAKMAAQPSELGGVISASGNLLGSVSGDLEHARVVRPGAVLGSVSSAWAAGPAAVAATGVSVTAWPGTPVTITVRPRPLGHAITRGQPVAQATVTIGGEVRHITLVAGRAVPAPSVRWLLTRL
jgi:hypothetical protein